MKNRAGLNNRQPVSHRLLVDDRIIYEADIVEIYKMRKPPYLRKLSSPVVAPNAPQ